MSYSRLYREATRKLSLCGISNSSNEVAWILEHAIGVTRLMIHTSPDQLITEEARETVWGYVERRASGEPIQYVLGTQDFWGMEFLVTKHVLIPRPETELLVEGVLTRLENQASPIIIDVGTGSGCVALALSREFPRATVLAIDRCPLAIGIAAKNAERHTLLDQVKFCVGDLLAPLLSARLVGKVTAIVANLPYIRESEFPGLSREVCDFEPKLALDGGPDGLAVYRRLLPEAAKVLGPKGHCIMEVGQGQAQLLCEEASASGDFLVNDIIHDSLGIQRIVCLERTG